MTRGYNVWVHMECVLAIYIYYVCLVMEVIIIPFFNDWVLCGVLCANHQCAQILGSCLANWHHMHSL